MGLDEELGSSGSRGEEAGEFKTGLRVDVGKEEERLACGIQGREGKRNNGGQDGGDG